VLPDGSADWTGRPVLPDGSADRLGRSRVWSGGSVLGSVRNRPVRDAAAARDEGSTYSTKPGDAVGRCSASRRRRNLGENPVGTGRSRSLSPG